MELNLASECQYCGTIYGLQVELLQNIEDMFNIFLVDTGEIKKMPNYKYQKWIRWFKERAEFRTTCMDCIEVIADFHRKV